MSGGIIAGGLLAIAGALLPWLALDGGLHPYPGTTGPFGWAIAVAGTLAVVAGLLTLRRSPRRLVQAIAVLGVALLSFAVWLLIGMEQIVHRPDATMMAPVPGPGLFVIMGGAALILVSSMLKARRFSGDPLAFEPSRATRSL